MLGVFNVIANTASRNESIFQLLHGGGGIILRSLGSFADLDRVPTNIADLDKGIGTAMLSRTHQTVSSGLEKLALAYGLMR